MKIKIDEPTTKTLIAWREYIDSLIEEYFPYSTATLTYQDDEILFDIEELNHYPIEVRKKGQNKKVWVVNPENMPSGDFEVLRFTVEGKKLIVPPKT